MNPQQAYEVSLLALCIWRESRGQTILAKLGVAWSIRNRVNHPGWWGTDWASVITKRWQFSSMTAPGDVNLVAWPLPVDTSWHASLDAAQQAYSGTGTDPTNGATHYFDQSLDSNPPNWATDGSMVQTVSIDALRFWKRA